MVKTAHWLLKYGTLLGIFSMLISIFIYIYIYGRVIRIMGKLDSRYISLLIINSYIFAFGLLCLLVSHGAL